MSVATVSQAVQLEHLLLQMCAIRASRARILELFGEKLIRGSAHPYIGKEAIAVGVCDALGPTTSSPARTAATATASPRASTCGR